MSRQRRIVRKTEPDDVPVVTALECVEADEFPSESAGAVARAIPDEAIGLRADVSTSPHGLEAFLAEDHAPAPPQERFGKDEFLAIDDPHDHYAREFDEPATETATGQSGFQARRWGSTAMMLMALSTSFFVSVILASEVLDWMNQGLLTSAGTPGSTPVAAGPTPGLATPVPHAPAVASHLGAVAKAVVKAPPAAAPRAARTATPPVAPPAARSVELPAPPSRAAMAVPPSTAIQPAPPSLAAALPAASSPAAPSPAALSPAAPSSAAPSPAAPSPATPSAAAAPPPPVARLISNEPSAAPPPRVPTEADQIGSVLTRYRGAFNSLDPAAARGVWPGVDERALSRAFAGLAQQEVDFQHCDIDVDGPRAAARCTGRARYVPKVGNRTPQTAARSWRFDLQKVDDRWIIAAVDAR